MVIPGCTSSAVALKHDPEKLADFSDKIMRPEKAHDPEKLADFADKIMRPEKAHDPEKFADFSDKIMRANKDGERDRPKLERSRSGRAQAGWSGPPPPTGTSSSRRRPPASAAIGSRSRRWMSLQIGATG